MRWCGEGRGGAGRGGFGRVMIGGKGVWMCEGGKET